MHLTCLASSDDRHLGVANDHLLLQGEPGIRLERVVADTPAIFCRSFGVRQHRSRLRSIHSASALVVTLKPDVPGWGPKVTAFAETRRDLFDAPENVFGLRRQYEYVLPVVKNIYGWNFFSRLGRKIDSRLPTSFNRLRSLHVCRS